MPLREVYYSAWDAGTYHTCVNCPNGQKIPSDYLRQTFFVPNYCHKCEICDELEQTRHGIFGIPSPWNSPVAEGHELHEIETKESNGIHKQAGPETDNLHFDSFSGEVLTC